MEQLGGLLPLILIFVVFWFLLIRPQQRKIKLHREMINNLKRGDKIVTSGGIIGTISKVEDNKELLVQISENVTVNVASGMVSELIQKKDLPSNNNQDQIKKSGSILSSLFEKKK